MQRPIVAGATDQTIDVFILDSASTTGAGKTGLAYNTASLTCYYRKNATGSATALTLATQTVGGAHSDGGFVEIDSTNMPGWYRLDLSDTIVATSGFADVVLRGASGMVQCNVTIPIWAVNPMSANGFMTGVNSVAPPSNWNLTSIDANGRLDVIKIAGTTQTAGDIWSRLGAPAGASMSADIASVKTDTGTTIPALIAALNNISAAQVNAEVVDALNVDTYAQPGQATPAATTTIRLMLAYLYKAWRNQSTQTSSQYSLLNDDAVTVDQKATFADDGTTATRGEITTGP